MSVKAAGAEANDSPTSSNEVKKTFIYTPTLQ
jgi:hypothetical protein